MKKILLGGAAALALSAGASSAADLPSRKGPPVTYAPLPPAFTWTGFYAGINAGYGFETDGSNSNSTLVTTPAGTALVVTSGNNFGRTRDADGFIGGGQIGYNFQFGQGSGFVVGVEADIQYADLSSGRNRDTLVGTINGVPFSLTGGVGASSLDYFGTVRGRIGYAFDRVLVYGTGGFAFGDTTSDRRTFTFGTGAGQTVFTARNNDDIRTGYAVGGGVEFALPTNSFLNVFSSSAVTFKIEGLYVNLDRGGNNGFAFAGTPALAAVAVANNRRDTEFAVVRAGLNFKF